MSDTDDARTQTAAAPDPPVSPPGRSRARQADAVDPRTRRRGGGPLRVVHCPVNTAGVPWTNVQAMRRRGVESSLVVFNRYALHPEAD